MIDRSETWDTPLRTVAFEVDLLFGIHVAELILAGVHVRAQQAGHMNAEFLQGGGRPHMSADGALPLLYGVC